MQRKLVEGIGDRRRQGADSIVAQKHTPLELQVVELKKKYPDILLIIEVSIVFRWPSWNSLVLEDDSL